MALAESVSSPPSAERVIVPQFFAMPCPELPHDSVLVDKAGVPQVLGALTGTVRAVQLLDTVACVASAVPVTG